MNFDKVEYDHPDGVRTLSPEEFRALGAVDRVKGIGQGRFQFFRAGVRITAAEALKVRRPA